MKRNLLKLLALMLAVLLVIAFAGGCSRKKDPPTDEPIDEEPIDEEPDDEEPVDVPGLSLDGEKTIFACWWDNNPQLGTPMADLTLALNEKYNTSIIWQNVAANEYLQKFTAGALSGSPESDVTYMRSNWMPSCMRKGMCYDLTPWVDFSDTAAFKELYTRLAGTLNGRVYGVKFGSGRETPLDLMIFNKAMAEREGIPNLYDMIKNKTFTYEKFLEFCLKVNRDTDGDGEIDQWGAGSVNPLNLIYANGGEMTRAEGDNVYVAFDSAEAVEALQFYQDLYQKHKVVSGGREGFQAGKALFLATQGWVLGDIKDNMADPYGIIYHPLGPKGTKYASTKEEIIVVALSACDTKAEAHFQVAKELLKKQPRQDDEPEPPLTATYERIAYDQESCELMVEMEFETSVITDYLAWESWSWEIWNMFGRIGNGEETAQAAVDAMKEQMQAGIEAVLAD